MGKSYCMRFFSHSKTQATKFDLAIRIGQGQIRVTIYTNYIGPKSSMQHAKFQDHRISGSGEDV